MSQAAGPTREASRRALAWALALTVVTMVLEAVVGFASGSLALLADAGHMLGDAAALGLALAAAALAALPAGGRRSFGHYRAEILAALANGIVLGVIAGGIVVEAIERMGAPAPIAGGPMLAVAVVGLAVNLACAAILHRARGEGLNVRAALLHVLGDTLGSLGAIVAGVVVLVTGRPGADLVVAGLIAALILVSAVRLVLDAVDVLLESVPRHLDSQEIARAFGGVAAVRSIHDLHVWCVTPGFECLSCHVVVEPEADGDAVLEALATLAATRFGIHHTTFQLEIADRRDREHVH